ncbi:hypothetical protein HY637_00830 [Candidatus Woesearchaeota archaeon]|nr:hypothetical protein [Candidatus Woesearchaeota archaeon]
MSNEYTFHFDRVETRSAVENGTPQYIVRGYATVPDVVHTYHYVTDRNGQPVKSFKEMFTRNAIESIERKSKNKKIFVDAEHEIFSILNTKKALASIQSRAGIDINAEAESILNSMKTTDLPLAKVHELKVDEKGLFVDTRLNPFYRDADEAHAKYFDAVWNSLQTGFLNGMSLNFKPTKILPGEIPKIDDADIYGISYTGGASHNFANITEVALRSAIETREGMTMSEESKNVNSVSKSDYEKLLAEKQASDQKLADINRQQEEMKRQKEKLDWEQEKNQLKTQMEELNKKVAEQLKPQPKGQYSAPAGQTQTTDTKAIMEKYFGEEPRDPKTFASNVARYAYYNNPMRRVTRDGVLGAAFQLQAEFGTYKHLEADPFVKKSSQDIVLHK